MVTVTFQKQTRSFNYTNGSEKPHARLCCSMPYFYILSEAIIYRHNELYKHRLTFANIN